MVEQRTLNAERAAFDKLLAAAQVVVNEGLDAAEERAHPCDVNDDEAKARLMPAPLQALYYAVQAARRAPPALDTEGLPAQWHERMAKQGWKPDQHAYHASKAAYMEEEIADLRAQLAHQTEAARRWESKLDSVWEGIRTAVSKYSCKPCEGEPFDALDELLARQSAPEGALVGMVPVPVEPTDEMVVAFAETWFSKVRPIDDCGMEDCYAAMLAAAPTSASAQPADHATPEGGKSHG